MLKAIKKHVILLVGGLVSLTLLLLFLSLQQCSPEYLKLETQWLAVALAPVLISLLAGGYIAKFKGFGLELEARLKSPVATVKLIATDAVSPLPSTDKGILEELNRMGESQVAKTSMLAFVNGRLKYYDPSIIQDYVDRLRNVSYLGIQEASGEFVCLVPIELLAQTSNASNTAYLTRRLDEGKVNHFIREIEKRGVLEAYKGKCISLVVQRDADLLDALRKMRQEGQKVAAVVDGQRKLLGLIKEADIEHRIADEVLSAKGGS